MLLVHVLGDSERLIALLYIAGDFRQIARRHAYRHRYRARLAVFNE